MIKRISEHVEVVFSFFYIHSLVHGFDYLREGKNHGHVHTYLFSLKTESFPSRFKQIRVHTLRFWVGFARPRENGSIFDGSMRIN